MKGKMTTLVALALAGSAAVAGAQRGGMGPMRGPVMGRGGAPGGMAAVIQRQLFRGITLTDTQKTQLRKLGDGGRTQMLALAKSAQADRQAMRTARENGDTVALKAARQKLEGWSNRGIALRGQVLQSARGILTADQQKQFDGNRTRLQHRAAAAQRYLRQQRTWSRRGAMMRAMGPNRWRFAPWGGRAGGPAFQHGGRFGPGRGGWFGRGQGFGPPNRGRGGPPPGGQPPDSSHTPPPIAG